jgi:hypothetical protein
LKSEELAGMTLLAMAKQWKKQVYDYKLAGSPAPKASREALRIAGALVSLVTGAVVCASFGACHRAKVPSPAGAGLNRSAPWIAASPNPVPAGSPDQQLGKTIVSWNSSGASPAQLYVKVNRSPEVLLSRGETGSVDVPWIAFDSFYEFRLYSGKHHSNLLAKVNVVRDE